MFVRASADQDAALKKLDRRRGFLLRGRRREIDRIELVYFPYYVFTIVLSVEGGKREIDVTTDGVIGEFAFLEIEALDFVDQVDAARFDFRIDQEQARDKVIDEYKWILVRHGFHRKNPPAIDEVDNARRMYYPYWVAYYKARRGYDFNVVDGVSLDPVGIRMRRAFLTAFSQMGET